MNSFLKKAGLGLVSSLIGFGMCFAGGLGDIPENVEVKILTESDCYKEYVSGEENKINAIGVMIRMFKVSTMMAYFDYCNRTGQVPTVHGCVDSKGVVIFLPTNTRGWHCGGTCNDTHFSFMLCEPDGLVYDATKSAIITTFDELTDDQKDEFEKVWKNGVWLTAVYCYKFGFDVTDNTVLGHCEAYKKTPVGDRNIRSKRLASNMATPEHVFPLFGKSMNMFREDVSVLLDNWRTNGISKELEEKINFIFNELEKYTYK